MSQSSGSSEITSDDKLWAALGYPIPIVALIMLLIDEKKKRAFIKYHAVHALALIAVLIVVEIVLGILQAILGAVHIPFVGAVIGCATPVLWLLLFWPAILAFQGKYFEVPFVTNFLRGQHWVA
jgi:uncharacterized membrane protein